VPVGLVYIETIADKEMIMEHLVMPLLQCKKQPSQNPDTTLLFVQARIISATDTQQTSDMAQVIGNILNGDTVLFIEKANSALVVGTRKVEKRSVEAPENEATVLGSQESFTDDIKINCSLILKRLPVPNLRFEEFTVGTLSCTKMKLIWLEGIANPEFINEARRRIRKIDIDNVDGIGVIGELIEDKPSSLFPKYRQTERPDVAARNLTDGHFLIICSNSPFAFIAPTLLWDNFRSMDDYEERSLTSSYLRIIRYVAFALSILISSLYLSFVTYNQAIVPPNLALNIAAGREGVPLPSVLELLFLTFFITIIREAGLRMPGSVGFFVATLAAVVIGQAVVTAGYVSPSLIIIVAIGTISSFAISTTTLVYPARLLNYIFIILAGCFGIFGVINGLVFLFWYLATLSSFGVPYLYPLIPLDKDGIKDLFVRSRLSVLKKRMKILSPQNRVRKGDKGIK
jgi:spore germination protein KA